MKRRWREAVVFSAALGLRAVFLAQWSRTPYFLYPQLDDQVHQWWALDILQGHLLRGKTFYSSPLYPYLMALTYKVCGVHPALILWLQAFLGAATCVILQLIAARLDDENSGLAAGLAGAAYIPFLYHTGFLLKETLVVFLLAAFSLSALKTQASRRTRDALVCGLLLGLTGLARGGSVLVLAPVFLSLLAVGRHIDFRRLAAAFVLGLCAALLPTIAHNASAKDIALISSSNGFAFFVGNNPRANGTMRYPEGVHSHPFLEERESAAVAERAEGKPLKPSQVSRYWYGRALGYIAAEPWGWTRLTLYKFALFWNCFELPDDYNMHFIERHTRTALSWPLLSYGWAATWGLIGLFLAFKGRPEARILAFLGAAYMVSVVIAIVTDRYRLPIVVFLIPFAGVFLSRLMAARDARAFRELGRAALWTAPLWILCHLPLLRYTADDESQGWARLEGVYSDRGDYQGALRAFGNALSARPESVGEGGFLAAGQAALNIGDKPGAAAIYREGARRYPASAELKAKAQAP